MPLAPTPSSALPSSSLSSSQTGRASRSGTWGCPASAHAFPESVTESQIDPLRHRGPPQCSPPHGRGPGRPATGLALPFPRAADPACCVLRGPLATIRHTLLSPAERPLPQPQFLGPPSLQDVSPGPQDGAGWASESSRSRAGVPDTPSVLLMTAPLLVRLSHGPAVPEKEGFGNGGCGGGREEAEAPASGCGF